LVDLAGVLGERSLRRTVERAAVLRALDADDVERILNSTRRRGAPTLRRILRDWRAISEDPGATRPTPGNVQLRSDLEARLLALIGAARLPMPLCNQAIAANGKRFEVDFLWPEDRLVIETDGRGYHDNPVAFERDRFRDRALHVAGYRVVRFTRNQIRDEADAVVAAIRRLLAQAKR
jgi:very-short-patch-repair endonuclease